MKRMKLNRLGCTLLAVAVAAGAGCGDEKVNLGDSRGDDAGTREMEVHNWGASLVDYAGSRDGYAEAKIWRFLRPHSFDDQCRRQRNLPGRRGPAPSAP